jgi:hypothetical protein
MQFRLMSLRTVAAVFLAILASAARLDAVWIETTQLVPSGAGANDHYSWRVAIDGNVAVVTRPGLFGNSGYASVWVRSAGVWNEAARLVPSFGDQDVGTALAISGDTIAVGGQFGVSGSAAWVFVRPNGGWAGTLNESAVLKDAGRPIAFAGSSIVAGPQVFKKPNSGWSGTVLAAATLKPSVASPGFGGSIAASGDTVVIGAPATDVGGLTESGKAYVFTKPGGGWSGAVFESAQLFPSNPAAYSAFGAAVAIDGKTAVVTSSTIQPGTQEGEGYVFVQPGGGWAGNLTEDARLDPSDVIYLDAYGSSVSISGDTVAIGDINGGTNSNNDGAVYVFERPAKGWSGVQTETQELGGPSSTAAFGWSVAVSGNTIVVGAPYEDVGGNGEQGQAHVYELFPVVVSRIRFLVEGPIRVLPGVPVQLRFAVRSAREVPLAPSGFVVVEDHEGHTCRAQLSPTGEGSCEITFASPGSFHLRAHYLGNFAFRPSVSPALHVIVQAGGG